MLDFLSFKSFISGFILIAIYNIGAFILPLFIWYFSKSLCQKLKLFKPSHDHIKAFVWASLSWKQRLALMAIFTSILLFIEVIWRMMIEFLIAYMQIRDALVLPHGVIQ